jgi:hypothetical protein
MDEVHPAAAGEQERSQEELGNEARVAGAVNVTMASRPSD